MFLLSHITKRITATSLLVVFLHVLVGQCLCAVAGGQARAAHLAAAGQGSGAPACHAAKARKQAHAPHQSAPASKQSHDCCKGKLAKVLKELSTPPVAKLLAEAPPVLALPPLQSLSWPAFTAWTSDAAVCLVPPRHLPPKIPDIRVFIGSLTV
jgi:hypothetical protein